MCSILKNLYNPHLHDFEKNSLCNMIIICFLPYFLFMIINKYDNNYTLKGLPVHVLFHHLIQSCWVLMFAVRDFML